MRIYGYEVPDDICERIGDVLGPLGSKWALPAITRLADGPMRYNDLRRSLPGVSQKVLTETLRTLEANGYVRRQVIEARPPQQVEYSLTEPCRTLLLPIRDLVQMAVEQRDGMAAAESHTRH